MPKTQYHVSQITTTNLNLGTGAGQKLSNVSQSVQAVIDDLEPNQQRMVFSRLASWCLQNLEQIEGYGQARTTAG